MACKKRQHMIEETDAGLVLVAATAFDAPRLNRLFWELQSMDVDIQIASGTIDLLEGEGRFVARAMTPPAERLG